MMIKEENPEEVGFQLSRTAEQVTLSLTHSVGDVLILRLQSPAELTYVTLQTETEMVDLS